MWARTAHEDYQERLYIFIMDDDSFVEYKKMSDDEEPTRVKHGYSQELVIQCYREQWY